ncbi:unnamed protein product [Pleuronectes platessa]|uniref:Protein CUSTOS n=1 Tax=Pleuronectes platessa TaxID=8262 RepID=A0A9N7Y077_PLEPL|nr:unnamed protein product [Pleuronectes platessa]
MAASVKKMVGVSDESSSSSSDDEALRRCQEAVWETRAVPEKEDNNVKQSKRIVVAEHEHDGNELQKRKPSLHLVWNQQNCDDADDQGFRLFSTSIPGQTAEEPPAPVRRRPAPSSSDSDSEMEARLREAAVSLKDLLPSLTLPSTQSPPSAEPPCSGIIKKKKKVAEGEEGHVVKKKKKRKQEESAQPPAPGFSGDVPQR